jgi:hypothetical protein
MITNTPFTRDCKDIKNSLTRIGYIISDMPGTTLSLAFCVENEDDIDIVRTDLETAIKPFKYFYVSNVRNLAEKILCVVSLNISKWQELRTYECLDTL